MFLNWPMDLADGSVVVIASDSPFVLGVLPSRIHVQWSLAVGGTLEDRPRYQNGSCFDPFPFPAATLQQEGKIAALAIDLDTHRKMRIAEHPHLTLTGLYNVLDALRAGRSLTDAERDVIDAGQVVILKNLHDELNATVAAAYGWPASLPATEVAKRIEALNRERAAEEAGGLIRWLRPAFQGPAELAARKEQLAMTVDAEAVLPAWPKQAPAQFVALRAALARSGLAGPAELARQFRNVRPAKLVPMLETLAALGQARPAGAGRYVA